MLSMAISACASLACNFFEKRLRFISVKICWVSLKVRAGAILISENQQPSFKSFDVPAHIQVTPQRSLYEKR